MDLISESFEQLHRKIANIENCLAILPVVSYERKDLKEINSKITEIEMLKESVDEILKMHEGLLKKEYDNTINNISSVQLKMMFVLEHFCDQEKLQTQDSRALNELQIQTPIKSMMNRPSAFAAFSEMGNTPKMFLEEYAKSPFVLKKKLLFQPSFNDFDVEQIARQDFAKIPQYMKGRSNLEELQEFLENVIVKTFTAKYTLFFKKRAALVPADYQLWDMYREQASYFEGCRFITQGDICRVIEKQVDKKVEAKLQMLRHLQIIKESRKSSVVCYIWCKS
ncbi:unnamed protein product [Diamesa hyperborea]